MALWQAISNSSSTRSIWLVRVPSKPISHSNGYHMHIICNSLSTKCISNTMVILMISDNSCHNMEPSWISMTGLSRTYFIIDKIWQIQSRYVINTTLPGVFSIRPVFGLGAVFALGLRPRANTGHLSQIPGRIRKTPGNIVYILYSNVK